MGSCDAPPQLTKQYPEMKLWKEASHVAPGVDE